MFSVCVGQPPEEGGRGLGAGRRGGPATKGIKGMRNAYLRTKTCGNAHIIFFWNNLDHNTVGIETFFWGGGTFFPDFPTKRLWVRLSIPG